MLTEKEIKKMIKDYRESRNKTKDDSLKKWCTDRVAQLEKQLDSMEQDGTVENTRLSEDC